MRRILVGVSVRDQGSGVAIAQLARINPPFRCGKGRPLILDGMAGGSAGREGAQQCDI